LDLQGPARTNLKAASVAGRPGFDSDHVPAHPLWGAPRIPGELLKLGVDIGQTSVAKYMVRQRKPPSPTWRTFLDHRWLEAGLGLWGGSE
jgi:hypothetical protein